jgi:hypothetical protein
VVYASADNDAAAEMMIEVVADAPLSAGDFIL